MPGRRWADLPLHASAGLGYQFFDHVYRQFEVALSAVGVREKIGGFTEESTAARWEFRYRRDMLGAENAIRCRPLACNEPDSVP